MAKRGITIILLLLILFRFGWLVYQNRSKYLPDYWARYPVLKAVYGESQYMMKNWKYWLPDEIVYSYAAGAYVKGASPILVEPTQPPLGKYIIGLSIFLTGNENIAVLIFFATLMTAMGMLVFLMTRNIIISLLVIFVSLFERLFTDQLAYTPLLDIFLITFILSAVISASYALIKQKPHYLLVAYSCFAAAAMSKVWIIAMVFMAPATVYILARRWRFYPYVLAGFVGMLCITLITYARLFYDNYNLIEVLKVQKWLYWYQGGKINRLFTIWPLIFLNKWYVWWGETSVSKDPNWSLSWPVVIGSGLVASVRVLGTLLDKTEPSVLLCTISIVSYSLFMSFGQASARYLLPLLPFCYALSAWMFYTVQKNIRRQK